MYQKVLISINKILKIHQNLFLKMMILQFLAKMSLKSKKVSMNCHLTTRMI